MSRDLDALFRYLDDLTERPPLDELAAAVSRHPITCDDVARFIRFGDRSYQRNPLRSGPCYQAWVMCWQNGQRSPIHDHAGSACVVRVLRGTLTETTFAFAPNGHVKAISSRDLDLGRVCATEDDDLHQVSNLQAGSADLVTLHVYSPPLVRMSTYSILGPVRGQDIWEVEFSNAAGI